jgi:predicted nucleotidyltransferase
MAFLHHKAGIDIITDELKQDKDVRAVIIGGSIAHKTEREDSDIDIMIVLSEKDYAQAANSIKIWYCNEVEAEGRTIPIDGKYISLSFIKEVAGKGSEPARYAFSGAFATYSEIKELQSLIEKAATYPKERKNGNIDAFWAQLKAWEWYAKEAIKRQNEYLLRMSADKAVLFAGRLLLAHNEMLFPHHKWFMSELEKATDKPENFMKMLNAVLEKPDAENMSRLVQSTQDFLSVNYELCKEWPNLFICDSELGWKTGNLSVENI